MPEQGRTIAADGRPPSEAEMRGSSDAAAGLHLVEARLAHCTPSERDAFWAAVRRCFGTPAPAEA